MTLDEYMKIDGQLGWSLYEEDRAGVAAGAIGITNSKGQKIEGVILVGSPYGDYLMVMLLPAPEMTFTSDDFITFEEFFKNDEGDS